VVVARQASVRGWARSTSEEFAARTAIKRAERDLPDGTTQGLALRATRFSYGHGPKNLAAVRTELADSSG